MICPMCEAQGLQSKVLAGPSSVTLIYSPPFYDENGAYHHHDLNTSTTQCKCSSGHEWTEVSRPSCWCGWPEVLQ